MAAFDCAASTSRSALAREAAPSCTCRASTIVSIGRAIISLVAVVSRARFLASYYLLLLVHLLRECGQIVRSRSRSGRGLVERFKGRSLVRPAGRQRSDGRLRRRRRLRPQWRHRCRLGHHRC
jgi:hypothetical protein